MILIYSVCRYVCVREKEGQTDRDRQTETDSAETFTEIDRDNQRRTEIEREINRERQRMTKVRDIQRRNYIHCTCTYLYRFIFCQLVFSIHSLQNEHRSIIIKLQLKISSHSYFLLHPYDYKLTR